MSGKKMKELKRIARENSNSYEMEKSIYKSLKKIDKNLKHGEGYFKK